MIEEWFLIVILFVQQTDGIDERKLHDLKFPSQETCELRAEWLEPFYTIQIGTRMLNKVGSYDVYKVGLSGELVGVSVGCEMRKRRDPKKWKRVGETGKDGSQVYTYPYPGILH